MKTLEAKLKENEVNIWKEKYNHIIMKKENISSFGKNYFYLFSFFKNY